MFCLLTKFHMSLQGVQSSICCTQKCYLVLVPALLNRVALNPPTTSVASGVATNFWPVFVGSPFPFYGFGPCFVLVVSCLMEDNVGAHSFKMHVLGTAKWKKQ